MMVDKGTGGPAYGHSVVQPPRNVERQRQIDDLRRRVEALEYAAVPAPARDDLPAVIAYMTAIVQEFRGRVLDLRYRRMPAGDGNGFATAVVSYRIANADQMITSRGCRIHELVEEKHPDLVGWVALEELF